MNKQSMGVRSTRASRSANVVVRATSAKLWIQNWKDKQSAQANRPSWFPGSPLPEHLDGSLPGDFGFDPLGLGTEPFKLKWYQQAELQNGRWAMLAVTGILFPEVLKTLGLGGPAAENPWFKAADFEYYAPASVLIVISNILFSWAEIRRYMDMQNPGSVNADPIFPSNKVSGTVGYPGFDPLGYSKGDLAIQKVKEIKNARLAMLAFAGFAAQAYTTGKTPLEGLSAHLADPFGTTVWSNDLARL